ncbi:MAG: hypothetical protein A2X94_17550 [Bdellovibrionales bacterium GWB1_55_8]|nr:MAG: hypothetical protein A2X94_17550 [Bdellovibrionales bacterium GWB1_55_8]
MILHKVLVVAFFLSSAIPASALILERELLDAQKKQQTPQSTLEQIPPPRPGEVRDSRGLTRSQLVGLGRFLFNKETFQGNGRTCATCHPAKNNFTIDPQYIATLPHNDPLFVAETKPALAKLENPALLRKLALICENLDGFDKPCVFRGVPHTLGLRMSITPPLDPNLPGNVRVPGTDVELANTTGWSGDGAPVGNGADGSLRLFALGAIVQHFPRTLKRVPGEDFRLPSDLELDALLEFQLSLGRQKDPDLASFNFKSAVVEQGKLIFQDQDPVTGGRCTLCHDNAGANRPPTNLNAGRNTLSDTRVELTRFTPAYLLQPDAIVVDGGFGKPPVLSPTIPPRTPLPDPGFGNGQFDAPSLVEAAITPPFFHNNMATTIEQAVGFFASAEFNQPNPIISLNSDKAIAIASFLRTLGALELIDRALGNNSDATDQDRYRGVEYLEVALKNTQDASKLLRDGVFLLFPEGQRYLETAGLLQKKAIKARSTFHRNHLLRYVAAELSKARREMVSEQGSFIRP